MTEILRDELKTDLSPRGRFVVMGVDRSNGSLVADSMRIDLTGKCKGRGVSIQVVVVCLCIAFFVWYGSCIAWSVVAVIDTVKFV